MVHGGRAKLLVSGLGPKEVKQAMLKRIGLWAFAGCGVAIFWAFFATAVSFFGKTFDFSHWTAFRLSYPLSWFGRMQMTYYVAILLNGAVYALVGLTTEPLWRRHRS